MENRIIHDICWILLLKEKYSKGQNKLLQINNIINPKKMYLKYKLIFAEPTRCYQFY